MILKFYSFVLIIVFVLSLCIIICPGLTQQNLTVSDVTKPYSELIFYKKENLSCGWGTKSVIFNSAGTKLYALNLEGMKIIEFDRAKKIRTREFIFKPTKAIGWDYQLKKPMPSFEEKPVEACFSHDDKILWVSLHNAGGIVSIVLKPVQFNLIASYPHKQLYIHDLQKQNTDTINVPFIRTGNIPKVIAKTQNDEYLLVSNWHSKTVSVLCINDSLPPFGTMVSTLKTTAIPRGIAVDEKQKKSYIAIMGGKQISILNHKNWKIEKNLNVLIGPRHIVLDSTGRLFVSFNREGKVACVDSRSGKILFTNVTHAEPRTIALSRNQKFLFVACYAGNSMDVFQINRNYFKRVYSFSLTGKPVGIALYESEDILEAWICMYKNPKLQILSFNKN